MKDLIAARLERGGAAALRGLGRRRTRPRRRAPADHVRHDGAEHELDCDFIAGCDGFHGVCRPAIPTASSPSTSSRIRSAGWGSSPKRRRRTDELIYAWHEHGFALYSMRSPTGQPPVPPGRAPTRTLERVAGRADLGRAQARPRSATVNDGPDLREGHHADAQLRHRPDAARPPVPGRRRRPHRPAHRRQGPEPRGQRRAPARRRPDRLLRDGSTPRSTPTRRPRCAASGARRTSPTT